MITIGVDVGGTFTDLVLRDGRTGAMHSLKTPSTPEDLARGVLNAIRLAEVPDADIAGITHGMTVATNTALEMNGARLGVLTTEGHRDVLVVGRGNRTRLYDIKAVRPSPLVPRRRILEVSERLTASGTVHKPLDEEQVIAACRHLQAAEVEAIAICFLHAYANSSHELRAAEIVRAQLPGVPVSLSHEILPEYREFERFSTTALNAYTRPITEPYLTRLSQELEKRGFASRPLIMMSNGGVLGTQTASRFPVRMMESGPAAGALVASYYAERLGLDRLLSFDMGGTTAKACLIEERKPTVTGLFEVDRMYRFKAGSGMPVIIPAIDMIEIGAGGGSLASVDSLGLLKVGPRSAGSEPGPACYGRGGETPAVTDADVVLGILDPDNFLGGEMKLDKAAAEAAIKPLADRLRTSVPQTARGIFQVVNESMAAAARAHATDRGIDYRGMPVLAFGGAGPVHACHVAELLESNSVIYPPLASVLSAFGTLVTPVRFDLARGSAGGIDWDTAEKTYADMVSEAGDALEAAGAPANVIQFVYGADIRYAGQQNEVTVDFDGNPCGTQDVDGMREAFETAYEAQYGLRLPDMPIEVVAWRISAHGPAVERHGTPDLSDNASEPKGIRDVLMGSTPEPVAVYDRPALAAGQQIPGPVIIEERETTIFILPGWHANVAKNGCITAERKE